MRINRIVQRHGARQETFNSKCDRIKEHTEKNPLDKVAQKCYNKFWNIKRAIDKITQKGV